MAIFQMGNLIFFCTKSTNRLIIEVTVKESPKANCSATILMSHILMASKLAAIYTHNPSLKFNSHCLYNSTCNSKRQTRGGGFYFATFATLSSVETLAAHACCAFYVINSSERVPPQCIREWRGRQPQRNETPPQPEFRCENTGVV